MCVIGTDREERTVMYILMIVWGGTEKHREMNVIYRRRVISNTGGEDTRRINILKKRLRVRLKVTSF